MKIHLIILTIAAGMLLAGCGGNGDSGQAESTAPPATPEKTESTAATAADPMDNKGIGPVSEVELGPVDAALAGEGQEIFESLCTACHKMDKRYIGPSLLEVTSRRSPEWIMNMIMNPTVMVQEDPIAKDLLAEYLSPMADQNISREQARKLLEYFRSVNPETN